MRCPLLFQRAVSAWFSLLDIRGLQTLENVDAPSLTAGANDGLSLYFHILAAA